MEVWKIISLSKWVICRFHVNLPGCIFPWDKNQKIPGYRGQPDRFCNAQGEPEVSDDACGIAGLTVGAVHLLSSI